jgi:uncharacterized iron-regulated protein
MLLRSPPGLESSPCDRHHAQEACSARATSAHRGLSICALLLGVAVGCGASSSSGPASPRQREALPEDIVEQSALPLFVLQGRDKLSEPQLWERMAEARVICFGEQHDLPEHHYAQQRALSELATRAAATQRTLGVGFEMFQRPYQAALTSFVAGATPEEQFLTDSNYAERWGFDFSLYRPLLKTVREFSLEALALNAPREITRKIGKNGLDGLDASERNQLPELVLDDRDHRAYFDDAMGDHPPMGGGADIDDMYAVQVVWDETMAETAAKWLSHAGSGSQLILFAGNGHCHESAIPARITRRTNIPVLSVAPVLASDLSDFEARKRYDWLVVLDD